MKLRKAAKKEMYIFLTFIYISGVLAGYGLFGLDILIWILMWSGLTWIAYGILKVLALLNPGRNTIATDLSYGLSIDQIRPSIDLDYFDSGPDYNNDPTYSFLSTNSYHQD